MKSYHVHYANKYPGGRVSSSDSAIDVHCKDGQHRVAMRKNGAGQWVDQSEEFGCVDRHDLAPIPKDARYLKLHADGKIRASEEHDDRKPKAHAYAEKNNGKVPSIAEQDAADKAAAAGQK